MSTKKPMKAPQMVFLAAGVIASDLSAPAIRVSEASDMGGHPSLGPDNRIGATWQSPLHRHRSRKRDNYLSIFDPAKSTRKTAVPVREGGHPNGGARAAGVARRGRSGWWAGLEGPGAEMVRRRGAPGCGWSEPRADHRRRRAP